MSEKANVAVREARAGDLPSLARLVGELGYAATEEQMQQRFERVTSDDAHRLFVAEAATGAVLSWVQVHYTRWMASDPRGEVVGLIVDSTVRGQGIERKLMQAAEAWTKEQGGSSLALKSRITRKETHVFYERLGYKVTKTSLNFSESL